MKRLLLICGLAALFMSPSALATARASITLVQPQPVPQGATVSFSYTLPNSAPSPRIVLYCYDASGAFIWGEGQWIADGVSFSLPTNAGTIASCTAVLGSFNKYFKALAQTSFAVSP